MEIYSLGNSTRIELPRNGELTLRDVLPDDLDEDDFISAATRTQVAAMAMVMETVTAMETVMVIQAHP